MGTKKRSSSRSKSPNGRSNSEEIPQPVKKFTAALSLALDNQDVFAISAQYEGSFVRISDKLFRTGKWPNPKEFEGVLSDIALALYTQLYYRHIMTNKDLRLDYADMKKSFENFRNLFAMINKDENIQIPSQWLWDMLEDFIDQFAFFQMYKDKIIGKFVDGEEAKKKEFAESGVWSFAAVLKILHSCVAAANVEIPKTESVSASVAGKKEKETIDEKEDFEEVVQEGQVIITNQKQLLACFALVSLSRVYAITGDFFSSLAMLAPVPLNRSMAVTRVFSCFLCLYYHMGLSYLMTRRYLDALRTFSTVLNAALRFKRRISKGPLDSIGGYTDKMFALVTIAYAISPQRLDDLVLSVIKETYDEQLQLMQTSSGAPQFTEMFAIGAPNFISLSLYGGKNEWISKLFLNDVSNRLKFGSIVSTLQLYSTISVGKLAKMIQVENSAVKEQLYEIKHLTHAPRWKGGSPSNGTFESSLNFDYYISQGSTIHISEVKIPRRYGEYFLRHIQRFDELHGLAK